MISLNEVAKIWKNYLETLYKGNDHILHTGKEEEIEQEDFGEPILGEEFTKALEDLKKAPGIDNIPAELLKKSGNNMEKALYILVCKIYDTGFSPQNFTKCISCLYQRKRMLSRVKITEL